MVKPRFVSLLLCCALLVPSSLSAHSAIEPSSRMQDAAWKARFELLDERAAAAGKNARIVFIGDSITQGWEFAGKHVWAEYYERRGALNLGIGGDRTQEVLWRLDHAKLDGLSPRLVVLMIGTNNIVSRTGANSVAQIIDGIRAVVGDLRSRWPRSRILLVSLLPRGENPSEVRGEVLQVNQVIQRFADDDRVEWVDFGARFVADDGTIPGRLMPDYLHLSEDGYRIWAESIEPQVTAALKDADKGIPASR